MLCFPNCDAKVRFIFECANLFAFFLKKNKWNGVCFALFVRIIDLSQKKYQINCEKIVLVNFNFYFSEICGVFFRRSVFFLVYVLSNKFELLYETDK